jgi:hypothetical protein
MMRHVAANARREAKRRQMARWRQRNKRGVPCMSAAIPRLC